jgi:hypothetical protein
LLNIFILKWIKMISNKSRTFVNTQDNQSHDKEITR